MHHRLAPQAHRGLRVGLGVLWLAALAACGPATAVDVQYHGYSLVPNPTTFRAGSVTFNLHNQDGQVLHEFVVVQTDLPADKLPMGTGSQVDETGLKIAGRSSKIDVGQSSTLTVNLAAGHYVLFCNIVGHYQLGMHTDFVVTE